MKASDSEPAEALRRAQQALTTGDVVTARRLARKALASQPPREGGRRGPRHPRPDRRGLAAGRLRRGGRSLLPPAGPGRRAPERTSREAASGHRGEQSGRGGRGRGRAPRGSAAAPAPLGRTGWLVLGAIVLLVNLPVLHLLVRQRAEGLGTRPLLRRLHRPGTVARNYRSHRRLPPGHQRRAALAGDQEQPALARRGAASRRGGGGLGPAHQPRGRDPGDALRKRDRRRHRLPGSPRPVEPDGLAADGSARAWCGWTRTGRRSPAWLSRARVPGDLRSAGLRQGARGCASRRRRSRSSLARLPDALRAPRARCCAGRSTGG